MGTLLDVRALSVRYGAVNAVRDAALTVREGEIVTLLGANGAGKSSTLNAITGLVPPAAGTISLFGRDIAGLAPEKIVRRGMSLTPEGRHVFANLTVEENLTIGAATIRDRAAADAARAEMLDLFPVLSERRGQLAGTLSGGEQQMLAIARSMMSLPKLLLLDEPSLGLAPQVVDRIFELIISLRDRGLTILLVEQNVELALEIADRGYVMASGDMVLSGTATDLAQSDGVERAYMGRA